MKIDTTNPARTPTELRHAAMVCAMRWRWSYDGYGSFEKAMAALSRRSRGFSRAEKEEALTRGRALYDAAEVAVEGLPQVSGFASPDDVPGVREALDRLRAAHPGFQDETYRDALYWAYYWIVLR